MKNRGLKVLAIAFTTSLLAMNASAAAVSDLKLSAATTVAAGNTLTVSEIFAAGISSPIQEIDSVIGFDPGVFTIGGFAIGSTFSAWSTTLSNSPSSGIYDYDIFGSSVSVTGGNNYTTLTFNLTALQNATLGNTIVYLRQNDGGSPTPIVTRVTNDGQSLLLSPAPANPTTVNSNDLTINVTGLATPEPATFLLMGFPLVGIALLRRRARQ